MPLKAEEVTRETTGKITVGELKKLLEGLPDDLPVCVPESFCDRYGAEYAQARHFQGSTTPIDFRDPRYKDIEGEVFEYYGAKRKYAVCVELS